MESRTSFTYTLTREQQAVLADLLRHGNYRPAVVPHTVVAADGDGCRIALFKSGKCLVQGKGAEDFVTFVLEPLVLQEAQLGYEDVLRPETTQPHMGVDESGKGDFFGPLTVAAAYVDRPLAEAFRALQVRDSKRITSDTTVLQMAREIRKLLGERYSVVLIGPARYNQLYARIRNVNALLAWAHARAIENLLAKVPACPRAISDQFGSKEQVRRALMQKGRAIELVQHPRAESDLAVAAASVLAREAFIYALRRLGDRYQVSLPKGAAAAVQEAAINLVQKHTPAVLLETAKCHFKTMDTVLERLKLDRSVLGPTGMVRSRPSLPRRRSVPGAPAAGGADRAN